jgi:replicative DNA helicase
LLNNKNLHDEKRAMLIRTGSKSLRKKVNFALVLMEVYYKYEIMPKTTEKKISPKRNKLHKCPTGIKGFDEITEGGLPKNRISLICGSTGSGKTLFGIDFLINGVINYNVSIRRNTSLFNCCG